MNLEWLAELYFSRNAHTGGFYPFSLSLPTGTHLHSFQDGSSSARKDCRGCYILSFVSKELTIPMTTSKAAWKKLRKNRVFPYTLISGYFMTPCLYTYIFLPLQLYKRTIKCTSNVHAQKGWISQSRLIYRNQTFQEQTWAVSISTLGDQLIDKTKAGQDRCAPRTC